MIEIVGVTAALFELLAVYLLGKKNPLGFISGTCGNILWITYVVNAQNTYGLVIVCVVAFYLNIKGYLNWTRPTYE